MVKRMRYGISVFDLAIRDLLAVAQTAYACGFDSIWIGEHLMLPVGYRSRHPTDNDRADVAVRWWRRARTCSTRGWASGPSDRPPATSVSPLASTCCRSDTLCYAR
jgi:alkanesulfonate monooxygenase SsuD/methylene tetrahydromethanopterin reductase-like flavin-dependent oxidoreductase (luciferase family)